MRKTSDADEIGSLVEADQIVDPGKGGNVGDGKGVARDPGAIRQLPVQYAQQALRFRDVAVARSLVFIVLSREFMEETHLPEHGADAAHLKHQPLEGLVAAGR